MLCCVVLCGVVRCCVSVVRYVVLRCAALCGVGLSSVELDFVVVS